MARRPPNVLSTMLACLVAGTLAAQTPPSSSLGGTVLDGTTGEPIAGAPVNLCYPWWGFPTNQEMQTDARGRFAFDVPPGSYSVCLGGKGIYVPDHMRVYEVGPSEHVSDIVKREWRGGTVEGRVLDERGQSAVGVRVVIVAARFPAGLEHLLVPITASAPYRLQSTITDDDGRFQFTNVPQAPIAVMSPWTTITVPAGLPLSAASMLHPFSARCAAWLAARCPASLTQGARWNDFVELVETGRKAPPSSSSAYTTQFTPQVEHGQRDNFIQLAAGERRLGLELRLRAAAAFRVSGHLVGVDVPAQGLALALDDEDLIRMASTPMPAAVCQTDAAGRFAFLRVPAGRYRVHLAGAASGRSPGGSVSADTAVAVSGDVIDLSVPVSRGVSIHGSIRFEGASPPPPVATPIRLQIGGADAATSSAIMYALGNRTFRSEALPPGQYLLIAYFDNQPQGAWHLKNAMVDGHDMADLPILLGTTDPGDVVVTFTDAPRGAVAGHVTTARGGPDAEASVLIFSTDRRYWTGQPFFGDSNKPRRIEIALSSRLGAFEFSNVRDGEYFLAAVPDSEQVWWTIIGETDPEFLAKLSTRAGRVTVKGGGRVVQDLQTIR